MSDPKLKMQDDAVEGQHSEILDTVVSVQFPPNMNLFTDIITDIIIIWKQTLLTVLLYLYVII